jgi:FSR family fosmidomycin resistance protein-like MFS transporter
MSLFSVGGNAGLALGPVLTTPLVLLFGLPGTLALALPPLAVAVLVARELPRLRALDAAGASRAAGLTRPENDWSAFTRLNGVVALRSGVYFGLQAFVPAYFVAELARTEAAGNGALTAMLAAGAVGTLVGGVLVDRWGAKVVLVGTTALTIPLLAALPLAGPFAATVLLSAIGFYTIASFSVTVVLAQAFLPSRTGLASGVTLGLSIGLGGAAALLLGIVADRVGLSAVLWVIAVLPVPSILLALSLPTESAPGRALAPAAAVGDD